MIDIQELLDDRSKLNAETLPELKELVEKYPFFQVARLLYVANLYQQHSPDFGPELRKASVFVPDRLALFTIAEGTNYQMPSVSSSTNDIEIEGSTERTMSIIDTFLSNGKAIEVEDEDSSERTQPTIADLTTDYASFLTHQPDTQQAKNVTKTNKVPKLRGGDLIDSFIKSTEGKQRMEFTNNDDSDFISPEISLEYEEIYTENMVNIYIQQARYQQALEILRKICTTNPKKCTNFAAQIKLLEIIIKENKQNKQ